MRIGFILAVATMLGGPAAAAPLYSSGFEGTDGGWISGGFGNWARGVPVAAQSSCDNPANTTGPAGANGGSEAWGTGLSSCYANANAASTLTRQFDLTGVITATFQWAQWHQVFVPFDSGELRANGDLLFSIPVATIVDWSIRSVDLTPYAGGLVTLEFSLFATDTVNRPGWFLDDMLLSDGTATAQVPLPAALPMLLVSLGLLALRGRRS